MKVFISQPMSGRTDEEILIKRNEIVNKLKEEYGEVEILDSFFTDFNPDVKPLEYLAKSIGYLAKADLAYFAKGWQDTRGCRIEHICAIEYGIQTVEEI